MFGMSTDDPIEKAIHKCLGSLSRDMVVKLLSINISMVGLVSIAKTIHTVQRDLLSSECIVRAK